MPSDWARPGAGQPKENSELRLNPTNQLSLSLFTFVRDLPPFIAINIAFLRRSAEWMVSFPDCPLL
jgi:hypothetical protein